MADELTATLARVETQVQEMIGLAADDGALAERVDAVSHWSVAEQLEHLAIADLQVVGLLGKLRANPDRDAGRRALPIGRVLLALNWIPRGLGKAPKDVRPRGVEATHLRTQLDALRDGLAGFAPQLPQLQSARGRFQHPRFGWLDLGQWLRFLEVHNHHHLKIVADIRRRGARR